MDVVLIGLGLFDSDVRIVFRDFSQLDDAILAESFVEDLTTVFGRHHDVVLCAVYTMPLFAVFHAASIAENGGSYPSPALRLGLAGGRVKQLYAKRWKRRKAERDYANFHLPIF